MFAGDHVPNFPLKHAQKDMRLACALGRQVGVRLPVAATADAAMRSAMRVGNLADLDFSATFEGQKKGSPSPYEVPVAALVGLAAVALMGVVVAIRGR